MNHPSSSPNPPVETGVGAHVETLDMINLDTPTEVRQFEKGRFEVYHVGPAVLGRATYEPGWRWSEHVGPTVGSASCQVEHVGLVLSGQAIARMDDGTERLMKAGDLFYVPPGHDSWVIGDEPYVSLHILGSEGYAAPADEHPTTPGHIERLESLYHAFNARDIELVLEQLGESVDWPNTWEGGRLHGRNAVRDYWNRQWATIDPRVEPTAYSSTSDGAIRVTVNQTVRDLRGALLDERQVQHVYHFRDGLIAKMDVEEPQRR